MNVVVAQPPMLAEIDKVFPDRGTEVIYAFGRTIYNPCGIQIPRSLMAHEGEHGHRQLHEMNLAADAGVELWWRTYLDDAEFRYREEVIGHAAELVSLTLGSRDRNWNARVLLSTATRLLAPLYAYTGRYSHKKAVHDLKQAAHRMSK